MWKKSESLGVLLGRLIMCCVCAWRGQQCRTAGGHSQQPADAVHSFWTCVKGRKGWIEVLSMTQGSGILVEDGTASAKGLIDGVKSLSGPPLCNLQRSRTLERDEIEASAHPCLCRNLSRPGSSAVGRCPAEGWRTTESSFGCSHELHVARLITASPLLL